jgi:hypothetical protein
MILRAFPDLGGTPSRRHSNRINGPAQERSWRAADAGESILDAAQLKGQGKLPSFCFALAKVVILI